MAGGAFVVFILFMLLFAILAVRADADSIVDPGYTLVGFENDSYRDYTYDALAALVGDDRRYLADYRCDGVRELDPFATPFRVNLAVNSLRVQGAEPSALFTYRAGVYSDAAGNVVAHPALDAFLRDLVPALAKLETLPSSARLLRVLERAPYAITIRSGNPHFSPAEPNGKPYQAIYMASTLQFFTTLRKPDDSLPFHEIGVGGSVLWSPTLNDSFIEDDGEKRVPPAYVALAHELFHSLDGVRGILDRRVVQGAAYEFAEAAEYRAVYLENQVRRESGRHYRKYYGAESGPGVLDASGNLVAIPAICLP